jgi:hypothetical protein
VDKNMNARDSSLRPSAGIPLLDRYRAASSELNERLGARQLTYLGHAAAAAAILQLFSTQFKNNALSDSSWDILLLLCPAIISIAFGCWIRTQDLTVGMLSTFCRVCEEQTVFDSNESEVETPNLPSWFSKDQGWQQSSMKHREWTEMAFIILNVLLAELPTLYITAVKNWTSSTKFALVLCLNHFVLGFSSWMILSIRDYRARLMTWKFEDGKLNESQKIHPHPADLMAYVGIIAGFSATIGWGLGTKVPVVAGYPTCAVLLVLGIAIGLRKWAMLMDDQFWTSRKSDRIRQRYRWYQAYWIGPILIVVSAIAMLIFQKFFSAKEPPLRLALFCSVLLLGYAIPETLLCWYRLRQSWFRKPKIIRGRYP